MDDNMKIGYCHFCGNSRMVRIEEDTDPDQMELDRLASAQCNCPESMKYREQEAQKAEMIDNICQLVGQKWEMAADILMGSIGSLQKRLIERVTIKIDSVYTVHLQRFGEDLRLRIEDHRKTEVTS